MWTVFTDGSAAPTNPGPGGAGSVILHNNEPVLELVYSGGWSTNQRMELQGVIMSFEYLPKDTKVVIYTDSTYVQKGLTEWSDNWIRRGWKTAAGKPVMNQELWKQLLELKKERPKVQLQWIKAHQDELPMSQRVVGWEWNVRADNLAKQGMERSNTEK